MKQLVIATFLFWNFFSVAGQDPQPFISVIPIPVAMQPGTGSFIIKNTTSIQLLGATDDTKRVSNFLAQKLNAATGFAIPVTLAGTSKNNTGNISLSIINDPILGNEGYKLNVTSSSVSLMANTPAGLFYGVQSIFQLLPKEIGSRSAVKNIAWTVPVVSITDYPRFGWRGLMLDVSRHFFSKEEVKKFIDDMVQYKYNLLHLHLTDDQGWRIEIKSLPNVKRRLGVYAN